MIRLVAVDMDGTLLNSQSAISSKNKQAILKLQDAGAEFIICTGRFYPDAYEILQEAGISCGFICLSGASIYDVEGNQLKNLPFTREQLDILVKLFDSHKLSMDFLTSEGSYTSFAKEEKLVYWQSIMERKYAPDCTPKKAKEMAVSRLESVCFMEQSSDIFKFNLEVYKICIDNLPEETVCRLKEEFLNYPQFAAASSFPTNIEITDVKAQKGIALKTYAESKGISDSEIMVLGDSDNDLSMFTMEFGYPVAMENAMDCIRQAAKYHTLSNDEDGVAHAIETYVLSKLK